jgi:hypothetical protein
LLSEQQSGQHASSAQDGVLQEIASAAKRVFHDFSLLRLKIR